MELRKEKRKREYKRGIGLSYSLGVLGLLLLVSAAFLGPKIVFDIQDKIRCREIDTKSPEEVDVTSFNTGYEMSLYKRLVRFAAGLAEEEQYYVSVQDMEITSEMKDWLQNYWYDSMGFSMLIWNLGVLPEEVITYDLLDWKRCVIYGDDFAGGVNFILWYLEVGSSDSPAVRLLLDGETGDIYGVRTDFSSYQLTTGEANSVRLSDFYNLEWLGDWSIMLGIYIGGIAELEGVFNYKADSGYGYEIFYDEYSPQHEITGRIRIGEVDILEPPYLDYQTENTEYNLDEINGIIKELRWVVEENGDINFYFPYGDNQMNFCFRLDGEIRAFNKWGTRYIDATIGFPEIYERVPVFMED